MLNAIQGRRTGFVEYNVGQVLNYATGTNNYDEVDIPRWATGGAKPGDYVTTDGNYDIYRNGFGHADTTSERFKAGGFIVVTEIMKGVAQGPFQAALSGNSDT